MLIRLRLTTFTVSLLLTAGSLFCQTSTLTTQ